MSEFMGTCEPSAVTIGDARVDQDLGTCISTNRHTLNFFRLKSAFFVLDRVRLC